MRSLSIFWLTAPALTVATHAAYGQALLVDRNFAANQGAAAPLGVSRGFLGDHFRVGARGEVWVIDRLAVWAIADPSNGGAPRLSDLYESVKLFGGIEARLPIPAGCACDKVVGLQRGNLQPGSDAADNAGIRITPATPGTWQVEFTDLKWLVPGGIPIQFGVLATGRPAGVLEQQRYTWLSHAAEDRGSHDLRLFDENGNLLGRFAPNGLPYSQQSPSVGMNVQVWGHKTAPIAIHSSGSLWEVELQSGNGFQPDAADPESLRFGPLRASPVMVAPAADRAGASLVMQFRPEETGIRRGGMSVCLVGNQRDGTPFEGCDLVPKQ
jgi:hypothetical protein